MSSRKPASHWFKSTASITPFRSNITIREENALATLEIISRFAVKPKWLIYLPPTMSPGETSSHVKFLDHPAEASSHYPARGVPRVICEQKHMRSRALHAKRSLVPREFALWIEALHQFVRKEPLRRVHECVFGVLALETNL